MEHKLCSVVWQQIMLCVWTHNSVAHNWPKNKMAAQINVSLFTQ